MKNWLAKLLPGDSGSVINTESAGSERFILSYKSDVIGTLDFRDGEWIYKYSEDFKRHGRLQPIADFPQVDRVYQSDTLWPFFASRIPGSGQPRMRTYIKKHEGRVYDVDLLKEFGTSNIANPFRLVSES